MTWRRLVVNLVGDADHGRLAESRFVQRPYLPGGEHNMYELAFAAAALGYPTELRGWLHRPTFDLMRERAGTQPEVDLPPRRPEAEELVVVPEGWRDPLEYGRMALSPAATALFVLAAPGLFGWPFTERWELPDPLTVPLDAVARPEHFTAPVSLGFRLLTHSPPLAETARAAGVACAFVGTGRPGWAPPPAREREVDVAAVMDNRWAPLAEDVLNGLGPEVTVDRIERVSNVEMIDRLSRARVLVWPSRIEGHATILWEARSAGCVPVALASNRFAVGLDAAHGTEVVQTVDELPDAVRALLASPSRWRDLSQRGRGSAPAEVDWDSYCERVQAFLTETTTPDPGNGARAALGEAVLRRDEARAAEAQARLEEATGELAAAKRDLTAATERQEELLAELERHREVVARVGELEGRLAAAVQAHDQAVAERDAARHELQVLRNSRGERVLSRVRQARRRLGG